MRGRRLPGRVGAQEAGPSLTLWRGSLLSWGPRWLLGDLAAQGQGPWGRSLRQRSGAGEVKNSYQPVGHQPIRMTRVPCMLGVAAFVAELRDGRLWGRVGGAEIYSHGRGQEVLREVRVATVYQIFKYWTILKSWSLPQHMCVPVLLLACWLSAL